MSYSENNINVSHVFLFVFVSKLCSIRHYENMSIWEWKCVLRTQKSQKSAKTRPTSKHSSASSGLIAPTERPNPIFGRTHSPAWHPHGTPPKCPILSPARSLGNGYNHDARKCPKYLKLKFSRYYGYLGKKNEIFSSNKNPCLHNFENSKFLKQLRKMQI